MDTFYHCRSLKVIWVEDGCAADVREIVDSQVSVFSAQTKLGGLFLRELRQLREVVIPDGVERIGDSWFRNSGVESVTFPVSLRELGEEAFYGCAQLRTVKFAEGGQLQTIGRQCFARCGLEEVTLPGTLKDVCSSAFLGCAGLRTIFAEEGCEADLAGIDVEYHVQIVSLSAALPGGVLLRDLRLQKNIAIPEGTERIGDYWFWGSGVESVEIPASVREIGACAFRNCGKLRSVVFKGAVSEESQLRVIGTGAFRGCSGLGDIGLPAGLEEIGAYAFAKSGLRSITTPPSVRVIRSGAFYLCGSLRRAVLNEGLEVLGEDGGRSSGWQDGVFQVSALEDVALP